MLRTREQRRQWAERWTGIDGQEPVPEGLWAELPGEMLQAVAGRRGFLRHGAAGVCWWKAAHDAVVRRLLLSWRTTTVGTMVRRFLAVASEEIRDQGAIQMLQGYRAQGCGLWATSAPSPLPTSAAATR